MFIIVLLSLWSEPARPKRQTIPGTPRDLNDKHLYIIKIPMQVGRIFTIDYTIINVRLLNNLKFKPVAWGT